MFNIINHTITNQGRRLLEQQLLHPYLDEQKLENCYNEIEEFIQFEKIYINDQNKGFLAEIRKKFNEFVDFERYHRKLSLATLQPDELLDLIQGYISFLNIIDWFYAANDEYPDKIKYIMNFQN